MLGSPGNLHNTGRVFVQLIHILDFVQLCCVIGPAQVLGRINGIFSTSLLHLSSPALRWSFIKLAPSISMESGSISLHSPVFPVKLVSVPRIMGCCLGCMNVPQCCPLITDYRHRALSQQSALPGCKLRPVHLQANNRANTQHRAFGGIEHRFCILGDI